MRRSLLVSLQESRVGHLSEDERGRVTFRFLDEYRQMPQRPVLSQAFEDDLEKTYHGKKGELPPFFANLVPEGPLRSLLESSLGLPAGDDLALLAAVGQDLPGAVDISPLEEETPAADARDEEESDSTGLEDAETPILRFSLAGVQLKFSVLREAEKLTIPARGQRGEWIVKLDSSRFPHVVENELATLEWARAAGFDVPECHLQPVSSLTAELRPYAGPDAKVLVIRRYDRDGDRRIHQEDFAQVVNLPPRRKYDQISYEQCAALVRQIIDEEAYFEFIRRLVFVIASGNTDAHLKNWSLVYPDGINARLSPLYDQVSTVCWEELPKVLSLNLSSQKQLLAVREMAFTRLAEKAGAEVDRTLRVVQESLERIAAAWSASVAKEVMPPAHVAALQAYWGEAPLLRGRKDAIQAR